MTSLRNAVTAIAPSAKVEPHAALLAPLSQLLRALTWLALGLVLLMTLDPAPILVLAPRDAHNRHRTPVEPPHLLASTDVQTARLFQRLISIAPVFGRLLGEDGHILFLS